jgi:hypothetical protein
MAERIPIPEMAQLTGRPFSFYPPVLNIEHNEWQLREATWSEMLVHNTKMDLEIWVPRRFVGQVSQIEKPVMIVGLNKELEYNAGIIRPHEKRVLNLPKAPAGPPAAESGTIPTPAMVAGVRLSGGTESRIVWLVGAVLLLGVLAAFIGVKLSRNDNVAFEAVLQEDLGLSAQDDYFAVVRKLGQPAQDRWKEPATEMQYRALSYPDRHLTVILMGTERNKALYIGAVNDGWRPVHTVLHAGGGSTRSLLERLQRF